MENILTIDDALKEVFILDNETLAAKLSVNYNTIASWRFNLKKKAMSTEKKTQILNRLNYKLIEQSKWKKQTK